MDIILLFKRYNYKLNNILNYILYLLYFPNLVNTKISNKWGIAKFS